MRIPNLLLLLAIAISFSALADEGMWTVDNFPSQRVQETHHAAIGRDWLDKVRLSTVRISGCSASFVSPEGLILTNHHCAEQCLAENSSAQNDILSNGFLAGERNKEIRCQTERADVLVELENITAKVEQATRGQADQAANDIRKKTLTQLEQACEQASQKSGALKCESVKLYQGGQYFLYKYKRYTDVRLVFAPEDGIAAFGGDPDNFQFPRWCLDMSVMRAYENGKPAKTPNHLRINWSGPAVGEFVLVSGHPGSTSRLLTVSQLEFLRNTYLPTWMLRASELRGRFIQFGKTGAEAQRIVSSPLMSLENSLKVRRKQLDALLDDNLLKKKRQDEQELRDKLKSLGTGAAIGDPWSDIAKAEEAQRNQFQPYVFIEDGAGFNSSLFRVARILVRAAAERPKPNAERLREFTDANLSSIEQQLFAAVPIYPEREMLTLSFSFERMREWLGPDHAIVRQLLKTDSPDTLAAQLVKGTKLGDVGARKALWEGGSAAIKASKDPMIVLALSIDPQARALRKQMEDQVEAPIEVAAEKIARARFAAYGTSVYPDATFTLRINYGTVKGWIENGTPVDPYTRLGRLFERATGKEPFRVPDSWLKVKDQLDLNTPFNLSTDNDIVGGNSGSPLINARGELVGLMFDGNIHSIAGSYWFDTVKNRSVAVHPAIIREALLKVYAAKTLAAELGAQ